MRFELAAPHSRYVDMHPVVLDEHGNGVQPGFDGRTFRYPSTPFNEELIGGRRITCISVDLQLGFHCGYDLRDTDRDDIEQLHQVAARTYDA